MKRSLLIQVPVYVAIRLALNTMMRMVYPFLPVFGRGLGVDLRTFSLALTLRASSGILGPLLASIGDSQGRKAGMLFGLALFTTGVGLMIFWPTYLAFTLSLILSTIGNLVFVPCMQAHVGDQVPYRRRGLVLAFTEIGWSLSFIIGVPIIGLLISRNGWRAPFPLLTGLGALAFLVLAGLLPKESRSTRGELGLRRNLRAVVTYPPALAGIFVGLTSSASNEMINVIFGVWLEDAFALKITALAAASAVIGISELGGESLVGIFADWLGKQRAVGIGLSLNSLAVLALPMLGQNLTGALIGLFLLYLTFEFTIVSNIPLMTEVLPTARATLMSAFVASTAVGRSIGALMAPSLYEFRGLTEASPLGAAPSLLLIVLVATGLNLIALLALRGVKIFLSENSE